MTGTFVTVSPLPYEVPCPWKSVDDDIECDVTVVLKWLVVLSVLNRYSNSRSMYSWPFAQLINTEPYPFDASLLKEQ